METKIATYKQYHVFYTTSRKLFVAKNDEGDEVASGQSQDEVEKKIDKLVKQKWNFPIEAYDVTGFQVIAGQITSVNPNDKSVRFVPEHGVSYQSHRKEHLRNSRLHEATEANKRLAEEVSKKREQIDGLQAEIKELCQKFERRIGFEYFGIKDSW